MRAQGIFFCALPPFNFDELGGKEEKGVPTFLYFQRWRFWYSYRRIGRASTEGTFFSFARSILMNWVRVGERGASGSYSQRWCFWYTCQRVGKANV